MPNVQPTRGPHPAQHPALLAFIPCCHLHSQNVLIEKQISRFARNDNSSYGFNVNPEIGTCCSAPLQPSVGFLNSLQARRRSHASAATIQPPLHRAVSSS